MARTPRLAAIGILIACIAIAMLVPSCGNDFDALFGEVADAGGDANGGGFDAEAGTLPDGGDRKDAGCTRVAQCPLPTEDCEGGTCAYECTGCGCGCSSMCKKSDNIRACSGRCTEGTSCGVTCGLTGTCAFACEGCNGKFTCESGATACSATCTSGATCDTTCAGAGSCQTACAPGASCILRCAASSASCDLECTGGTKQSCAGGVLTCDHPCP